MMSSILRLISRRVAPPSHRLLLLLSPPKNSFSTAAHRELLRRPTSPWLMLPPSFIKGGSDMVYNFYSPTNGKVVSFNNRGGKEETELMRDRLTHLVGSSHGWLAYFTARSRRMFLWNPISGRRKELPPLAGGPITVQDDMRCPGKVIITSSPEEEDCRAVVILPSTNRVAFCCPARGDAEWTPLGQWKTDPFGPYELATVGEYRFHHDLVHSAARKTLFGVSASACCRQEDLEGWDMTDPDGPITIRVDRFGKTGWDKTDTSRGTYLVPSDHQLFIVRANVRETVEFNVYRIDDGGRGLEVCSSLGDVAMFVGINHSFAVKASEFPGLKPNCIYYSDVSKGYPHAQFIGIFDYKTKTASPLYYTPLKQKDFTPHPWFTPTLD